MSTLRVAVVGHVEWVDFLVVERLPVPGEILHVRDAFQAPGGGGSMAAYALRALAGACDFFCAVGEDARGAEAVEGLRAAGLELHVAVHARPQRRTVTYLDARAERTITVIGERLVPGGADPLPWDALAGADAVYFTGGDAGALQAARAARVLVATPRARAALLACDVRVDALVGSGSDPGEVIDDALRARARHVVQTAGARGGTWTASDGATGAWAPAPLPAAPVDAYGCGDTFAAAVAYGLADGRGVQGACELGARCGAAVLCQRAPAVGDLAALR